MSTWLDRLPTPERQRLREKLRSPAEYEKLRERVKGPEDLEREMEKNEYMADLQFALETEPAVEQALKEQILDDLRERGAEEIVEGDTAALQKIESGKFDVRVVTNRETQQEQIVLVPEGTVAERFPLQVTISEQYAAAMARDMQA
jgi:hypothetical protein